MLKYTPDLSSIAYFPNGKHSFRGQDTLTKEQLAFIVAPALTSFGPFNIYARLQWDIIGLNWLIGLLDLGGGSGSFPLIGLVLTVVVWAYQIRFGRMLAWNRNNWVSFEAFHQSERRWQPWGLLFFGLAILVALTNGQFTALPF
jgi:hypothetical protein